MARFAEPTQDQLLGWADWVAELPKSVRDIAERLDIWTLYRMKSTGQRVQIVAFSEDGTLRVNVDPAYNLTLFGVQVFGVNPADLDECDLPSPDEAVGELLAPDQQLDFINARRASNGLEPLAEMPQ